MDNERKKLTPEEAIAMLPDDEMIHTFRQPSPWYPELLGCDWTREEIVELMRTGEPELSGEVATGLGHGLAVFAGGWMFVETKQ